ncbi:MAG: OmpH family outer membrane protein [Deinococcales bacterium]
MCAALCFSLIFSQKLSAQGNYSRIVLSTQQEHGTPAVDAVTAIQARQEAEQPYRAATQVLQQKPSRVRTQSSKSKDQADILIRTLQSYQQRYARRNSASLWSHFVQAVNQAITGIAKANGYTMVLDGNIAGKMVLVWLSMLKRGLDITDQVIAAVRQNFPKLIEITNTPSLNQNSGLLILKMFRLKLQP